MSPTDLIQAILNFGTVVVSVPEFLDRHPFPLAQFNALVEASIIDGLVEVTEDIAAGFQNLSLTPLAADRLMVKLDARSRLWVSIHTPLKPLPKRSIDRRREIELSQIATDSQAAKGFEVDLADTRANSPPENCIVSEQIARFDREIRRERIDDFEPKPPQNRVLISLGRPWPIQGDCCQGIDLKYGEYCPWCDRSGADSLIPDESAIREQAEKMRRMRDGEDPPSPLRSAS